MPPHNMSSIAHVCNTDDIKTLRTPRYPRIDKVKIYKYDVTNHVRTVDRAVAVIVDVCT